MAEHVNSKISNKGERIDMAAKKKAKKKKR